jgi:hypothetical protein
MKHFTIKHCLAGASLVAASFAAHAGFLGQAVEARAFFPALPPGNSTNGGPVTAVVGAGVEFANGAFTPFFGPSFDFSDTSIAIVQTATGHQSAAFNGWQFFDVNGTIDDITGVSIAGDSSGFFSADPGRITFDANHIWINFQGLSFGQVAEIGLNVTFGNAVPEPGSAALAGLALLAAAGLRRRAR